MHVSAVTGAVSKQLVRVDSKYAGLFSDSAWKESTADRLDMSARFGRYYSELVANCFLLIAAVQMNRCYN